MTFGKQIPHAVKGMNTANTPAKPVGSSAAPKTITDGVNLKKGYSVLGDKGKSPRAVAQNK